MGVFGINSILWYVLKLFEDRLKIILNIIDLDNVLVGNRSTDKVIVYVRKCYLPLDKKSVTFTSQIESFTVQPHTLEIFHGNEVVVRCSFENLSRKMRSIKHICANLIRSTPFYKIFSQQHLNITKCSWNKILIASLLLERLPITMYKSRRIW